MQTEVGEPPKRTTLFTFRQPKNVVEVNGLGITERFFYKTPPHKQQVLMCIMLRVRLPPQCNNILDPQRIVDLTKIAQAKHYRLSASIDHDTLTALPFAENAKDLPLNYRFIERNGDNWMETYTDEINQNFDINDATRPLWRTAIVVPKDWMPKPGSELHEKQTTLFPAHKEKDYPILFDRTASTNIGLNPPTPLADSAYFDIMFTFHHCLGDGLSMLAFVRTWFEAADASHFMSSDLKLDSILVNKEPPPVLDNLFHPSLFEVFPTAAGLAIKTFGKKPKKLGHALHTQENVPVLAAASEPEFENPVTPLPPTTSPAPISLGIEASRGYTNARFMYFTSDFMEVLRKRSKAEKTTVSAVLVVAALTACRAVFIHSAQRDGKAVETSVPSSQGWVVTSSIRHILPNSRLLQGENKENDASLKVFGGYAGSVSNSSLKLTNDSRIWDRCRVVKKGILTSLRASIQRMKVANYAYRHPKLWNLMEKKVDLAKLSKSYSVEVANLNAWEYPCAPPDAPADDERARLDYFGGALNSSFEGSRGLFSCGVITFGGNMSVFVSYDVRNVAVDEAEVFFKSFSQTLEKLSVAPAGTTVADILL
ncbi:hypothetical protein HDU79_001953 [Rhizoclosmatium sp. JEL0117]|nr:hypothetical protein HDU79_001953 [Rhizoclosmatium sp. JEL0117]